MPSLLLVEDDWVQANLLPDYLRRAGYDVYFASDADVARALCRERCPDVVVLHLAGRADGISTMRLAPEIRFEFPHIPLVAVAQTPEPGITISCGSYEHTLPLEWPVTGEQLLEALREVAPAAASGPSCEFDESGEPKRTVRWGDRPHALR